jgi:hypothetical protein
VFGAFPSISPVAIGVTLRYVLPSLGPVMVVPVAGGSVTTGGVAPSGRMGARGRRCPISSGRRFLGRRPTGCGLSGRRSRGGRARTPPSVDPLPENLVARAVPTGSRGCRRGWARPAKGQRATRSLVGGGGHPRSSGANLMARQHGIPDQDGKSQQAQAHSDDDRPGCGRRLVRHSSIIRHIAAATFPSAHF